MLRTGEVVETGERKTILLDREKDSFKTTLERIYLNKKSTKIPKEEFFKKD